MRVAYFTAGNAGAGHLVRGIALQRGLARRGVRADYRMFGPALPFAAASRPDYSVVPIDQFELRDARRAPESELARSLRAFAPDLLLVDCYWAPLRHILPLPGCEAWLLARWLPAQWFPGPPDARWEPRQYRRIVAIEPFAAVPGTTDSVPPLVVCNPGEARPRGALRALLGVPEGMPLRVIVHAGVAGEIDRLAAGAHEPPRRLSLHDPAAPFPLAEWLGDADEIFCAAGYNSYWEARWMRTEARTRFAVVERQRPEQQWRLRACAAAPVAENGADVLARSIE